MSLSRSLQYASLTLTGWKQIALWVGGAVGLFVLALVNSSTHLDSCRTRRALGLFIEATILRRRVSVDDSDLEGVATIASARTESEQ